MSELNLITCTCPAPAGQVCPVPHDRWLGRFPAVVPIGVPYPCACDRRGCNPNWCPCAGRADVEAVPERCCARNGNTPRAAAIAKHASDYRTCWCKGDIDRHTREVAPAVVALIPDVTDDDEEED